MTRHGDSSDSTGIVPAAEFDVRQFAREAHGSHRASLQLERYEQAPLDPATLEIVDLLGRLERSALSYLRSVLVTPTHKDARLTAFLVTWAYEKYWVADALELVVAAHPGYAPSVTGGVPRIARLRHGFGERMEPIRESVVSNLIGEDVIAVHTLTGALDEWITQAAYESLLAAGDNEEFQHTLELLRPVKRRHGEYFAADARDRLAASPKAAPLARRRLRRAAFPLGAPEEPPALLARLLGEVIPARELAAIDLRFNAFEGLAGLDLVAAAAGRAAKASGR
ncbi:MAG: hypothetical protein VB093_02085 [Propionicimonas sp.]|nr:hypothetical protein [Propionicimonas sp.]